MTLPRELLVKIIAHTSYGDATGTGFAVSADGKIATNYHVIEGASKIFVKLPKGKTVGGAARYRFRQARRLGDSAGAGRLVAPAAAG